MSPCPSLQVPGPEGGAMFSSPSERSMLDQTLVFNIDLPWGLKKGLGWRETESEAAGSWLNGAPPESVQECPVSTLGWPALAFPLN